MQSGRRQEAARHLDGAATLHAMTLRGVMVRRRLGILMEVQPLVWDLRSRGCQEQATVGSGPQGQVTPGSGCQEQGTPGSGPSLACSRACA